MKVDLLSILIIVIILIYQIVDMPYFKLLKYKLKKKKNRTVILNKDKCIFKIYFYNIVIFLL